MSRILSQTLIRESQALIHDPPPSCRPPFFASRFVSLRAQSKRPEKAQLYELDLGADGSESESGPEAPLGMKRLQEAIHAIVIRRAAPGWIAFAPGSSYWVPPAVRAIPMTDEEELALSSPGGWPSFSYFVEGVLPTKVDTSPKKASRGPEIASPTSDED